MESKNIKVYMIGIGGSSMRGICEILLEKGMDVSGSDPNGAPLLELRGVNVFKTHEAKNIALDTQIVIYSSAIGDDNPELIFARESGMCVFSRGEILGLISRGFKTCIAVSGSHGKTTTTAMIGEIFAFAGVKCTMHFGGEGVRDKTCGGGEIFLCEACEYCDNFLNLAPTLGVILNVEYDHPDYFESLAMLETSFAKFAENSKGVLCTVETAKRLRLKNCITCGVYHVAREYENFTPTFSARNLREDGGYYSFDFYRGGSVVCDISLKVLGEFNVENALFACVVGFLSGASPYEIQKGISGFFGVKRRLWEVEKNGVKLIFDYAHHPTQIKAVSGLFSNGELVIFQPHTYSRTEAFFDDFVSALSVFKNLIITETYPAREKYSEAGSGKRLAKAIPQAVYVEKCDLTKAIEMSGFEKVILLGAGEWLCHN